MPSPTHRRVRPCSLVPDVYRTLKEAPCPLFQTVINFMAGIITTLFMWTHSYAVAIILLTIGIRIIIMPLYQRQMISMKRMQEIQPKIKQLQEKFKGEPQRLNQAQMDLYREFKINPLSGCLPMVIQLPLLWTIYAALVHFKYVGPSGFLWIPSLSGVDHLYILPILAAVTTFWQTRISTPTTGDKTQQILTSVLLPVFIGYMSTRFPAGLALYWVVSNLFAIAQQYLMVGTFSSGTGGATNNAEGAVKR